MTHHPFQSQVNLSIKMELKYDPKTVLSSLVKEELAMLQLRTIRHLETLICCQTLQT